MNMRRTRSAGNSKRRTRYLPISNLYVEKGRWSRVPRENRMCDCKQAFQDEEHILLDCTQTERIRENFQVDREIYGDVGLLMDT